ncbi:MAG: flagellar biosynthetic protein FliR [Fuerstiella sp.]
MFEAVVIACMLILFRCAAFVAFLPPVAGKNIPQPVKIGLAVALALALAPRFAGDTALQLMATVRGENGWLMLAWLAGRETMLGIAIAWLFGLCLVPVRIAGAWVAQEMGLTMAQMASAADDQQSNVVSQGFEALGILLFFGLNLHHAMFLTLSSSFATRPVARNWSMPDWDQVLFAVTRVEHQGFLAIAPIGILMFVVTMTLLVTMRTAPQFNFMTYGMSLRLAVGVGGLVLFLPDVINAVQHFLNHVAAGSWAGHG